METIRSIKDDRIVLARALKTRRGRGAHKKILLEGEQALDWALERGLPVEFVLAAEPSAAEIADWYTSQGVEICAVSEGVLKKVTNTRYLIPVVGIAQMPPGPSDKTLADFVLVLDGVQDLGNLGTIVRTCQAFGIREVLSTSPKLDLYQRKTIDASRGSVFSARFGRCESPKAAIRRLKTLGYQVVATSPRGTSLQSLVQLDPRPVALVVGNESTGISPAVAEQADWLVQIPMSEAIESLNVGVAAGISVYELRLKQVLTMIEQRIKSTLGRELNVAGMLVQQALDAELRKVSNLDSRRVIFMMVLKCDCTMSVEDMCKQFGVLQSEAQAFLVPLLKAGLVTHDDVLELTPSGEQVLAKLWFTVQATEDKILSEFTPEQAAALRQQLTHVQRRCLEIIDDSGPRSS